MTDADKKDLKYIRFKQRFENFDKAYAQFQVILKKNPKDDIVVRTALIQTFEFTFELAWKVMQDLLEVKNGIEASSPRLVLQEAYQQKYFADVKPWAKAMKKRNESSHAYAEAIAVDVEHFIRSVYASLLESFYAFAKENL
jgi:nucleotidyltransferase substrate binding protein (TIGR01987 family)